MSILQLLATGTLFSNVGHRPHCHSFCQAFAQCEVQAVKGVQIENCRAGVQLQGGACSCVALFAKVKKKKTSEDGNTFFSMGLKSHCKNQQALCIQDMLTYQVPGYGLKKLLHQLTHLLYMFMDCGVPIRVKGRHRPWGSGHQV